MSTDMPDDPRVKYVILAGGPRDQWLMAVPSGQPEIVVPSLTRRGPSDEPVYETTTYRERSEGSLIFDHVPAKRGRRRT